MVLTDLQFIGLDARVPGEQSSSADLYEKAIRRALYYRAVCLEAAGSPKFGIIRAELERLADMWERFAEQVKEDRRRVADTVDFLARIDDQFGFGKEPRNRRPTTEGQAPPLE